MGLYFFDFGLDAYGKIPYDNSIDNKQALQRLTRRETHEHN